MKKISFSLIVVLILISSAIAVCAIPFPWGIAIKPSTKECAGYWAGDKYVTYDLPPEWTAHYPDEKGIIKTETGQCYFGVERNAEACCKELGLVFVASNIGKGGFFTAQTFFWAICAVILLIVLFFLIWLIIKKYKEKKTNG